MLVTCRFASPVTPPACRLTVHARYYYAADTQHIIYAREIADAASAIVIAAYRLSDISRWRRRRPMPSPYARGRYACAALARSTP